jgi:uncharacterized protein
MSFENCCCLVGKKSQANTSLTSGFLSFISLLLIGLYRSVFTAHFGAGVCRFEPSCSLYANQAFREFPFLKALKLTTVRVLKCRPGSSFGFDPIPESNNNVAEKNHEQ